MGNERDPGQTVEVSTDPGYAFEHEGVRVDEHGVRMSREEAEKLRAVNRSLPQPTTLHVHTVKEGEGE